MARNKKSAAPHEPENAAAKSNNMKIITENQTASRASMEPIPLDESRRLLVLEQTIEAGKKTFIEVGAALAEIRDSRLYRSDNSTFEEYCLKRWGFKRAHAHRLIEAAATANQMSPIGDIKTESQARELSKVPKDKRPTVLTKASAKACSQGRDITANDIKQAAGRTIEPKPGIKRQFPVAAKSQGNAKAWWYRSAKPEGRGTFISMLVSMNCPVHVNDKDNFKRQVLQWLDTNVKATPGRFSISAQSLRELARQRRLKRIPGGMVLNLDQKPNARPNLK